jgi:transcriptional regulator GlxA family with amidase domain
VSKSRYCRDGKYITGAGVSASIDAALFFTTLTAGERVARLIQLGIEYYPAPPFEARSADEVPAQAREAVLLFEKTTAIERLGRRPPF